MRKHETDSTRQDKTRKVLFAILYIGDFVAKGVISGLRWLLNTLDCRTTLTTPTYITIMFLNNLFLENKYHNTESVFHCCFDEPDRAGIGLTLG